MKLTVAYYATSFDIFCSELLSVPSYHNNDHRVLLRVPAGRWSHCMGHELVVSVGDGKNCCPSLPRFWRDSTYNEESNFYRIVPIMKLQVHFFGLAAVMYGFQSNKKKISNTNPVCRAGRWRDRSTQSPHFLRHYVVHCEHARRVSTFDVPHFSHSFTGV